jgi:outer membrane protein OmpA-like peptidoglycan-associated protein
MKRIVLLCIFTSHVFAQNVLVDDDFFTDNHTFVSESTHQYQTEVKNGAFIMNIKANDAFWFYQYFSLDNTEENFTLEATLEQKKGAKSTYYGLVIGLFGDQSNYMNFYINNQGYFYITHYYAGKFHNYVNRTYSSAIHKNGPQTLRVERSFNICKYYINETLVHQDAERVYYGNGFGIQILKRGEYWLDHFKLTKTKKEYHLVNNPVIGRKMENLGANINTAYTEIAPVVAPDGKTLFFVREGSPFNAGGPKQDVWYSKLDQYGNWGPAINMGYPINNSGSNFVENITPDNNKVYVGNTYTIFGEQEGKGISSSVRTQNGWTIPRALYIHNFVNNGNYVDYYPDLSNRFILMAIDNGNTYGGMDLFISFEEYDGSYSTPLNLGPQINTCGDEFGISLAADGKTLYFNSHGHTSYGSADVFVAKRLDDSWTNWSEPLNLGPEINSDAWEGQISIDANGEYGYISTTRNGMNGSEDIFRFEMGSAKPEPVVIIYGRVLHAKTTTPLGAPILYNNLSDNSLLGTATSDENTGLYKIVLPAGKAYTFNADKQGYYAVSENIDLTQVTEYTEIERNLYLSPIEVGDVIRLNNIFFDTDKADLKPESEAELNRLFNFLNANPNLEIEILGHTDNKGSDEHNQNLSQSRVDAVVQYLKNKGIAAYRLKGTGYGESKPIAPNETEEGRALNRRVEFLIAKN